MENSKKMGFWDLFKKKKEPVKRARRKRKDPKLKEAFDKVARDVSKIRLEQKNQAELIENNSTRLEKLEVLPKQFKDMQKQFTELIMKSVSSPITSPTVHQKASEVSEVHEPVLENLTPHTKQAFSLIVGLLNECKEEWLPISDLTTELYPNKEASKIRNAVSNTIKPLLINKIIERKREGNYVSIKLTKFGYTTSQNILSKNQLKNLAKFYTK